MPEGAVKVSLVIGLGWSYPSDVSTDQARFVLFEANMIYHDIDFPFDIHLCGSQLFGRATKDSDWDYFANFDDVPTDFLIKNNFECKSGKYININRKWKIVKVEPYKFARQVCRHEEKKIDLILCNDLKLHLDALNYMLSWGELYNFKREDRSKIWDLVKEILINKGPK